MGFAEGQQVDGRQQAISGSQYKPPCSRIDTWDQAMDWELKDMFPATDHMGPDYDRWTTMTEMVARMTQGGGAQGELEGCIR